MDKKPNDNMPAKATVQIPDDRQRPPSRRKRAGATKVSDVMSQVSTRPRPFYARPLPLQNETVYFVFVNCLDIFMTYILLRFGGLEANPVAEFFLSRWNVIGLVSFKMAMVAFVVTVAHMVSHRSEAKGRLLLWTGSTIVAAVVIYSVGLFLLHILLPGNVPEMDI